MRRWRVGLLVVVTAVSAVVPLWRPLGQSAARQDAATIVLQATVRDFTDTHPDFESTISGLVTGLVAPNLGDDGRPVLVGPDRRGGITSPATFGQWFTDVPEVNQTTTVPLTLSETAPGSGVFVHESAALFPIDGQLFGDQGRAHNFHFTLEAHATFTYQGGEVLEIAGDDDIWVFVDNRLVIDLGGVHATESASARLDDLGLTAGETYTFDLFFAERHTVQSTFRLRTTILLQPVE